jgi:thioredoxin reductase (NADPH)
MSTEELYDMIIIGGGPGGLTAGIYAMRAAMKTILIEKSAYGGQMTLSGKVENYPIQPEKKTERILQECDILFRL